MQSVRAVLRGLGYTTWGLLPSYNGMQMSGDTNDQDSFNQDKVIQEANMLVQLALPPRISLGIEHLTMTYQLDISCS